jgi:glyoxylase-like metal-dependent hydrolase (beta-lactamase superfamily II)
MAAIAISCGTPPATGSSLVLDGDEPIALSPDFVIIPTPGHTRGHCVLLYQRRFLFTGDHLWWNRMDQRLGASAQFCWYSWAEQIRSMAKLQDFTFEWVVPGHGQRVQLTPERMQAELAALVERMRTGA